MAYIVEQKIKGKIYLYEVESYWDKDKKQPRQRRKYIGPKNGKRESVLKQKPSQLMTRNYGNIFFLNFIADKLGITDTLETVFPGSFREILALAYFEITEGNALYLFPYWLEEQFLPGTKKIYSSAISDLCETVGRSQAQRFGFTRKWIENLKPIKGIYYDITSVSGYSNNIDYIEWGYNRDKENMPQLNVGIVFCKNNMLPIYYNIYPGSIVDVSTLKNCIKYLNLLNINDILLILDKGFFSISNITELNKDLIGFIQPLPFTLKKVKKLLKIKRKHIQNPINSFKFKEEVLFYLKDTLEFNDTSFDAHIYFNEKSEVARRHNFLSCLLTIEEKLRNIKFDSLKEYSDHKRYNIPEKYTEYFKLNMKSLTIEKNIRKIREHTSTFGNAVFLTNRKNMDRNDLICHYRRRDSVEKIFDVFKNEMDGDRLRAHSNYNTEGRLFIKFIALIIYMKISAIMDENKLFDKYTVKELIAELKKLKLSVVDDKSIMSEMTKKQKLIYECFSIDEKMVLHSY